MKIAIASEGPKTDSSVSAVAGRAPYFLLFEDRELVEVVENPFTELAGRVGQSITELLADKNVDEVLAAQFGPKMEHAMQEFEISYRVVEQAPVSEVLPA